MDSVTNSVNDRFHGAADHARHDHVLVSRYGAGDAYPGEVAEARLLVKRCSHCAQLAQDIDALRLAASDLPAARRTRDFRLTDEQAERLHGSALQRWFRRLATPGLAPLRPLAGVAVSVGLVLVVVGAALPAPAGETFMLNGEPSPAWADLPADRAGAQASPLAPGGVMEGFGPTPTTETVDTSSVDLDQELAATAAADATRSMLVYGGLIIAVLSLGLLVLLVIARRRGTDPLLR
jgi:hypothetical protein